LALLSYKTTPLPWCPGTTVVGAYNQNKCFSASCNISTRIILLVRFLKSEEKNTEVIRKEIMSNVTD